MIGVIFEFGSSMVEVRIQDTNCYFRTGDYNGGFATIDSLKLDKDGSIKEHPDLKNDEQWREKTIQRFKDKIKSLKSEEERIRYIIDDLSKFGYVARYLQKQGHRVVKLK
jgi:hypothetical protein